MDIVHVNNSKEHKVTDIPQAGQYFKVHFWEINECFLHTAN